MLLSNKKYATPAQVLQSLVDDFGNQIQIGDQKDIGEFNLNLLERVEEGLGENQKKSLLDQMSDVESLNDMGREELKNENYSLNRQSSMLSDEAQSPLMENGD
jgi:hypothetical protein